MKHLTERQRKELDHEIDSLSGNINRICVTADKVELVAMADVAKKRIDKIIQINLERLGV